MFLYMSSSRRGLQDLLLRTSLYTESCWECLTIVPLGFDVLLAFEFEGTDPVQNWLPTTWRGLRCDPAICT